MNKAFLLPFVAPARLANRAAVLANEREDDRDMITQLLTLALGSLQAAEAAEALLERFGSLDEALEADSASLAAMPELGAIGAAALSAVRDVAARIARRRARDQIALRTGAELLAHLRKARQVGWTVLFLDASGALIAEEVPRCSPATLPGYVLRRAMVLDVDVVVLARRSEGEPSFGEEDLELVRSVAPSMPLMGLTLRDLIVFSDTDQVSLWQTPPDV